MAIQYKTSAAPVIVVLPEEIDVTNAHSIREQIHPALSPGVTVVIADMTSTAFCDGSGLRNLLIAHEHAQASGAQLRVVIHPGAAWRALPTLGFDRLPSVYPSLELAELGELAT